MARNWKPTRAGKSGSVNRSSWHFKKGNGGNELYRIALDGKTEPRQLSQTSGKIIDYSSSLDGEYFIMSIGNDKNGADFWISDRDGSHQHKLLDCGSDRCTTAVWSPLSNEIAYTRESAGLDPNGAKGAPRVWILDVESGETAPLFSDSQKIGYGPVWSPDGKYLSTWNGIAGGVQVVERKTGAITLLQTQSGDTGCWSPDGSALYYTNLIIGQSSFHNVILKADMLQGTIQTVLGSNLEGEGLNYDLPACHPSRNLVAASVQPNARIPARIWPFSIWIPMKAPQ
jgi:Tol biopolymer transport system component